MARPFIVAAAVSTAVVEVQNNVRGLTTPGRSSVGKPSAHRTPVSRLLMRRSAQSRSSVGKSRSGAPSRRNKPTKCRSQPHGSMRTTAAQSGISTPSVPPDSGKCRHTSPAAAHSRGSSASA